MTFIPSLNKNQNVRPAYCCVFNFRTSQSLSFISSKMKYFSSEGFLIVFFKALECEFFGVFLFFILMRNSTFLANSFIHLIQDSLPCLFSLSCSVYSTCWNELGILCNFHGQFGGWSKFLSGLAGGWTVTQKNRDKHSHSLLRVHPGGNVGGFTVSNTHTQRLLHTDKHCNLQMNSGYGQRRIAHSILYTHTLSLISQTYWNLNYNVYLPYLNFNTYSPSILWLHSEDQPLPVPHTHTDTQCVIMSIVFSSCCRENFSILVMLLSFYQILTDSLSEAVWPYVHK